MANGWDGSREPGRNTRMIPNSIAGVPFVLTHRESTPDPGATPVLLTDLAAGWALTAGPQQTLDSSGVIASGALDLTAVGSPTYDANGVNLVEASAQYLYHAYAASFNIAGKHWMVCLELKTTAGILAFPFTFAPVEGQPQKIFPVYSDTKCYFDTYEQGDVYGRAESADGAISVGARAFLAMWYNPTTKTTYGKVNGAATVSAVGTNALYWEGTELIWIGTDGFPEFDLMTGQIRRVRLWVANSALAASEAANLSWLYNSGAGRSDAEIAAYTG